MNFVTLFCSIVHRECIPAGQSHKTVRKGILMQHLRRKRSDFWQTLNWKYHASKAEVNEQSSSVNISSVTCHRSSCALFTWLGTYRLFLLPKDETQVKRASLGIDSWHQIAEILWQSVDGFRPSSRYGRWLEGIDVGITEAASWRR